MAGEAAVQLPLAPDRTAFDLEDLRNYAMSKQDLQLRDVQTKETYDNPAPVLCQRVLSTK